MLVSLTTHPPVPTAWIHEPLNPPCSTDTTMTNAGLLLKDSIESRSLHAESSSVSPEPDLGSTLIVSIVWTALDSRYLSTLHSSFHPHPQHAHTTSQCHFSLESTREGGGEKSQALGCQLTRDGGQGLPEDTGSYAETAQGRVAAPTPRTLRMKGAGVHRCLICSTSLRLCRILVGGLHWFVIAAGGLSLVAVSRGHSLVAFCVLLIAITSLVAEHELQSVQASVVVTCRLSCCGT